MRTYMMSAILLSICCLPSCRDVFEARPVDLTITPAVMEIKAGEFVQFDFEGEADYVVFYSGEPGFEYRYRNRYFIEGGIGKLSFSSTTAPVRDNLTERSMNVLLSTDFNEEYDYASVRAATWVDLTEQFTWPSGSGNFPAGEVDITQYATEKPIYVAFKYVGKSDASQPAWIIKNFVVTYEFDTQITTIINGINMMNSEPGFRFIYEPEEEDTRKWTINAAQMRMANAAAGVDDFESWAITKGFYLNKTEPDACEIVMDLVTKKIYHQHVYAEPGVYTAVFVCKNATIEGETVAVKEFTITVTD